MQRLVDIYKTAFIQNIKMNLYFLYWFINNHTRKENLDKLFKLISHTLSVDYGYLFE